MAQFVNASFVGTSGTGLSSHDSNWTLHPATSTGGCVISNANRCRRNNNNTTIYYHAGTPASADYEVEAPLFAKETDGGASSTGVTGRTDTTAASFYHARYGGGTTDGWQLFKFVGGTPTQLGSTSSQSLTDETSNAVKLRMVGTTIELYKQGGGSATISVTDSAISAAGKVGIRFVGTGETDTTGLHIDGPLTADDIGGGTTYDETVTDAASAADALTAAITAAVAITEAATGTDAQTSTLAAVVTLTEAASGADAIAALTSKDVTLTEAADATDNATVVATLATMIAEAGSATDAAIAVMTMAAAITEAATASDSVTWGSVTYDVDLTESASAGDTQSAAAVLAAVLAEGGTAADAIAAVQLLGATVTELGSAADAATSVVVMGLSITEAGVASDVWIASIPSAGPAPTSRQWLIASESRIWLIPAESRN